MDDAAWTDTAVAKYVALFREIVKRPALKQSFVNVWLVPTSRYDWCDDAEWRKLAESLAVLARMAKRGGLAGIALDSEDYSRVRQFIRADSDLPYAETAKLARQRGRECFSAIFREFPDITLFGFWFLSGTGAYRDSDDPVYLCERRNDLWPAFVNGMLDVIPQTARFVDGDEVAGYDGEAENGDFWKNAVTIFNRLLPLVEPENRAKYRSQVVTGAGLYLDSYTTKEGGVLYKGPLDGSRLGRFAANYAQAVRATGGFVWLYGERYGYIPWKNAGNRDWRNHKTWDEALSGFNRCVAAREHAADYVPGKKIGDVDVAQNRGRIVWNKVICKQPGRYCGWPTVCRRAVSDELIVAFSGDRDGHICPYGRLQLVRSENWGASWSAPWSLPGSSLDDRAVGIVALRDGTLLASWLASDAFAKASYSAKRSVYKQHMMKIPSEIARKSRGTNVLVSKDGAKTWVSAKGMLGFTPHGPTELADGRLLQIGRCADDDGTISPAELARTDKAEIVVEESEDKGKTWRVVFRFKFESPEDLAFYRDAHVVEAADGRLVALARCEIAPECLVSTESSDGGKTWTSFAPTRICGGWPPHLIRLDSGKLLCSYARRGVGGLGEYACFSDDDGRTWDVGNEVKIASHFNDDLGYPSSVQLPNGEIVTVYYQSDRKGEYPSIKATCWSPVK